MTKISRRYGKIISAALSVTLILTMAFSDRFAVRADAAVTYTDMYNNPFLNALDYTNTSCGGGNGCEDWLSAFNRAGLLFTGRWGAVANNIQTGDVLPWNWFNGTYGTTRIPYSLASGTGLETSDGVPDFGAMGTLNCASFAAYVLFNYLPNVEHITVNISCDFSTISSASWANAMDAQGIPSRQISSSEIRDASFWDSIPIGSIIFFSNAYGKVYAHTGIYCGYADGVAWIIHSGGAFQSSYGPYAGQWQETGPCYNTITEIYDNGRQDTPWIVYVPTYEDETQKQDNASIGPFVDRLYRVCLGRDPDPSGFDNWCQFLRLRTATGAQTAAGFLFSDEFKAKNLCSEDYVRSLYRVLLGREAEPAGLADWISRLEGGWTREAVFNGFVGSDEFTGICSTYGIARGDGIAVPQYGTVPTGACSVCGKSDGVTAFVTRLYGVCLDRDPDAAGLADWTNQLWQHTNSGAGVARGFVFSSEFTGRNYANEQYVTYLYRSLLGREPDAAGFADWVGRLAGGVSRQDVFDGFAGSDEFSVLCNRYGIVRG